MNLAMREKRHRTLVLGVAGPAVRQEMQGGNCRHGVHGQKKDQAKCRQPAAGPFHQLHYALFLIHVRGIANNFSYKQFFGSRPNLNWLLLPISPKSARAKKSANNHHSCLNAPINQRTVLPRNNLIPCPNIHVKLRFGFC
jgi:hypothetical protein